MGKNSWLKLDSYILSKNAPVLSSPVNKQMSNAVPAKCNIPVIS